MSMSKMYLAVPVERRMASAPCFVKSLKTTKKTKMRKRITRMKTTKKERGIRNDDGRLSLSTQGDFVVGGRNAITLPLCCGGSHFIRCENLVGM